MWLTIPLVATTESRIEDVAIADSGWAEKHWRTISHSYARARCFASESEWLRDLYLGTSDTRLSEVNHRFIKAICSRLGIATKLTWSMDYGGGGRKTERLLDLCEASGAGTYVSGPKAKDYIQESEFEARGIDLTYFDYSGYPEYDQPFPPFDHFVSIVDLLLNEGDNARAFMKSQ
jgi:hypothetical protein